MGFRSSFSRNVKVFVLFISIALYISEHMTCFLKRNYFTNKFKLIFDASFTTHMCFLGKKLQCDTSEQLRNVQKINVVHFSYKPEFSSMFGLSLKEEDTGIIAQEVQAVLPEAVTNAGGIALPNGEVYNDFLVVNKVSHPRICFVFSAPEETLTKFGNPNLL